MVKVLSPAALRPSTVEQAHSILQASMSSPWRQRKRRRAWAARPRRGRTKPGVVPGTAPPPPTQAPPAHLLQAQQVRGEASSAAAEHPVVPPQPPPRLVDRIPQWRAKRRRKSRHEGQEQVVSALYTPGAVQRASGRLAAPPPLSENRFYSSTPGELSMSLALRSSRLVESPTPSVVASVSDEKLAPEAPRHARTHEQRRNSYTSYLRSKVHGSRSSYARAEKAAHQFVVRGWRLK